MVYKRSRGKMSMRKRSRRTVYPRYKTVGASRAPTRVVKPGAISRFYRTFLANQTAITVSGASGLAVTTQLSYLPSPAEITDLFQEYRITKITHTLLFDINVSMSSGVSNNIRLPRVYWAIDPDDGTTPTSASSLMEYTRGGIWTPGESGGSAVKRISYVPKVSSMYYVSAVATGYGPSQSYTWLSTSSTAIPHYGMKLWLEAPGNPSYNFMVYTRCTIECRSAH